MRAVVIADERSSAAALVLNSRVPALRRALGLSASCLPPVSGEDQGQSGAADPLCAPELLLWPHVPQRRGSERAEPNVGSSRTPTRAVTGPPARRRACASSAMSARLCNPWLRALSASAGLSRSPRAAAASDIGRGSAPALERLRRGGAMNATADAITSASMLADLKLPGALEAVDEILADVDRGSLNASAAHRAAARCADHSAQQPPVADRDAILAVAGHQDAQNSSTSPSSLRSGANRSRACTNSASSSARRT